MKNVIRGIFGLITMILLSACGADTTKELMVFEENIGMPDDFLGMYEVKVKPIEDFKLEDKAILVVYYSNSKYRTFSHLKGTLTKKDKNEKTTTIPIASIEECTFIPSKVPNTKDYYIWAYPKCNNILYYIVDGKKIVDNSNSINLVKYIKKEQDNLMTWNNFLSNEEEKMSTDKVKEIIISSYKKTFIQNAGEIAIRIEQPPKQIENIVQKTIDDTKEKYKNYMPKEEYDRLEKEYNLFTYHDRDTGLIWQDNSDVKNIKRDWYGAKAYCKTLSLEGKSDWKLPSRDELDGLMGKIKYFKNYPFGDYWSSSQYTSHEKFAWRVAFQDSGIMSSNGEDKTDECYVRCVRGRQ